jgi:hypothetical protein
MEIILFIFGLFVGYQLGQAILSWRLKDILIREAKREGIDVSEFEDDELTKSKVNQLFIERTNDVLYLYDRDANAFVCQATSIDELAKLAKEYKNIKYAAVLDQTTDDVFAFVDGKVRHNILANTHES